MISRFLKEKCNILFAKESILIWSGIICIVCSDKIICWLKNVTSVWNNWIKARRGTADFVKRDNDGKFAYLTIKDDGFACFARAVFSSILYISKPFSLNQRFEMTCFYSCVDDVITWRQVFSSYQFNFRKHFANILQAKRLGIFKGKFQKRKVI